MKYTGLLLLVMQTITCSCQTNEKEMFRIIVQPEAEINKTIDFRIYFDSPPDEGSLQIGTIDGLDTDYNVPIQKTGTEYSFNTYAKPTKLGKIDIPVISVKLNGTEYKSNRFSINVVETMDVSANSVKTVLMSDKSTYKLQDTIKLSLYQYARFSNVRKHLPEEDDRPSLNDVSMEGEGNEIKINMEKTLYDISGIRSLDDYLEKNFEIVDFDWNPLDENPIMEEMDGEYYIRTDIFSIFFIANKKGKYTFQPSIFEYLIYKSNTDYFERFVPNDDGSYTITDKGATTQKVTSNTVTITVR